MSLDALRWAFTCMVGSSAERLVLLALANDCRRAGAIAFPSRERLHQVTHLDPKTITAALKKLEQASLIASTGEHKGRTGRIPVYRVLVGKRAVANPPENGDIKSGKNGAIRTLAMAPDFRANDTKFPLLNDTKNGGQNRERLKPGKSRRPDWLPVDAWDDYAKMRERIGYPLNAESRKRALDSLEQLRERGQDLQAVLEQSTLRCWRGLFEVKRGTAASKRKALDADLSRTDYAAGLPERAKAAA